MSTPHFETPEYTIEDLDKMTFLKERFGAPVHEHEIYMTFNNDCDAINFDEWWHTLGKELFLGSLRAAI